MCDNMTYDSDHINLLLCIEFRGNGDGVDDRTGARQSPRVVFAGSQKRVRNSTARDRAVRSR